MDRIAIFALASAMGLVAIAAEIGGMQVTFVHDGEVRGSFVNRSTYYKPWDVDGVDKLGVVIASWHNDMAGHNGRDVLLNNNFALAVVMFSDVQWNGREKNRPDLHFRMPAVGTPEFAEAVRFENAVAAQRDKVLEDVQLPFAWVRGMDMRWRLTDGKTGEVLAEDIPGGCVQIHGFSPPGVGRCRSRNHSALKG